MPVEDLRPTKMSKREGKKPAPADDDGMPVAMPVDDDDDDDPDDDDYKNGNETENSEASCDSDEMHVSASQASAHFSASQASVHNSPKKVPLVVDISGSPVMASAEQMLHQVLQKMSKFEGSLEELTKDAGKAARKAMNALSKDSPSKDGKFLMSPSQKTFGSKRKIAFQVALKIVFMKAAMTSTQVPLHEVVGPIMLALKVEVDGRYKGSIGGAFTLQFKKALHAVLREAKCKLVTIILDTFIMCHQGIKERVPPACTFLFTQRKAEHQAVFAKLREAPGGFDLRTWPNMHAWHTKIVNNGRTAYVSLGLELGLGLGLRLGLGAGAQHVRRT